MDWQSKHKIAKADGEELKLFVRSSPRELESVDLDRVAGGSGAVWVPNG